MNTNPNEIQITVSRANLSCVVATSFSSLAFLSSSVFVTNLSSLVATIFFSLAFLSSSVSMANLSHLVAAPFPSLALLSSSVSTDNLRCLLVTTFSSLSFLSNSFSSPRFNLLRVARRCFLWSSVSDDPLFSSCFGSSSCSIFFESYPQPFFLLFFSLHFFVVVFVSMLKLL